MKHNLIDYLTDYSTLTPTDSDVGTAVSTSDWWEELAAQFDDLIWMYFPDRTVFINPKFDPEDRATTYTNIIRTFSIFLRSKKRQYDRIYGVINEEYNPLWNVDGVTGTISQDTHTGTDTMNRTGTDTSRLSGSDVDRLTGSDTTAQSGRDVDTLGGSDNVQASGTDTSTAEISKDETTRTGSQTAAKTGTDTHDHGVFTFDDTANSKPSSIDSDTFGSSETTTYNNVKDAHTAESESSTQYGRRDTTTYGRTDTMQYGKTDTTTYGKTDTMTYGKQDQMQYNSQNQETKDLLDEHIDLVIRQGNIGVTMSQQLLDAELAAWDNEKTDFFKRVVRECVNQVTYAVQGV